jgi:hypothetical protein
MRYGISLVSALAALLVAPAPGHAQETRVFRASSAWALDYGDDYCRLMRDFSDGTDTIGLFIERTQPGPMMRLIVVGDSIRLFRGSEQIGYRMSPSGAPRTVPRLRYATSTGDQYLNLGPATFADMPAPAAGGPFAMPPPYTAEAEVAAATQVTGIALGQGLTAPALIETGAMSEPAGALQACADDLIASWGLDAEKHRSLSRPAMPSGPTAGWIAADTIPFADFAKLSGGNNEYRVMIDAAGKPTACHVQWPTLDDGTNRKICDAVIEKGAFMPALDQSGQAMDSYWTTSAFFLMPPFGRR